MKRFIIIITLSLLAIDSFSKNLDKDTNATLTTYIEVIVNDDNVVSGVFQFNKDNIIFLIGYDKTESFILETLSSNTVKQIVLTDQLLKYQRKAQKVKIIGKIITIEVNVNEMKGNVYYSKTKYCILTFNITNP